MTRVEAGDLDRLLDALQSRNTASAVELALGLADEGVPVAHVLQHLIAPAQDEMGRRWHRNEIGVADEHAATAVVEAVVAVLGAASAPATSAPTVVVACAEGEWHIMPARLLAEGLRADGCAVTFLGGSMPPDHLGRFLDRFHADVVAISCSTPLTFGGVLSSVEVVHRAGLPALVGGRAMGTDDRRARALGADLWAPDAGAAAELLRRPLPLSRNSPTADVATASKLARDRDAIVAEALALLSERFEALARYSAAQLARTEEDLGYILQFAEAAVLVRDPALFDEFWNWLDVLLTSRGLPAQATSLSLDALSDATRQHPDLQRLFSRVASR